MADILRPDLSVVFSANLRTRLNDLLESAVAEAAGKIGSDLSWLWPTVRGAYVSNIVNRDLKELAKVDTNGLQRVPGGTVNRFRVGPVGFVHYQVHPQGDGRDAVLDDGSGPEGEEMVTNARKNYVANWLDGEGQLSLLRGDQVPPELKPPFDYLAILGTEIEFLKPLGQIRLRQAFIRYPKEVDKDRAVVAWHEGSLDLLVRPPVSLPENVVALDRLRVRRKADNEAAEEDPK